MAKTNPCQICGEVPAAEFTLSAADPTLAWFANEDGTPRLTTNVCEGCLINAAYQRTVQLAEVQAREDGPILAEIDAGPEQVMSDGAHGRSPKRGKTAAPGNGPEMAETGPAPPDG